MLKISTSRLHLANFRFWLLTWKTRVCTMPKTQEQLAVPHPDAWFKTDQTYCRKTLCVALKAER